jgi:serine/threonine protein phosphatase PrpC
VRDDDEDTLEVALMANGRASGLFIDQSMSEGIFQDMAGGQIALFTVRAPESEKPNQDSAALIELSENAAVFAVADGAGGLPAGAKASSLAVTNLEKAVTSEGEEVLRSRILDGIERANAAILELGLGAATTLAVVEIQDAVLRPYHVGDSQIMVVGQRGKVKLVTVNHSPVGYQVEAGVLQPHEALHHEDLALVSNLVGQADMRIEVGAPLELAPYDTVVIGSDGLFDNLTVDEIVELVRAGPLEEVAKNLAEQCKNRMLAPEEGQPSKPDDLTFVVFRLAPKK